MIKCLLHLFLQIERVQSLHDKELVHCALKPGKFLIGSGEHPKASSTVYLIGKAKFPSTKCTAFSLTIYRFWLSKAVL